MENLVCEIRELWAPFSRKGEFEISTETSQFHDLLEHIISEASHLMWTTAKLY